MCNRNFNYTKNKKWLIKQLIDINNENYKIIILADWGGEKILEGIKILISEKLINNKTVLFVSMRGEGNTTYELKNFDLTKKGEYFILNKWGKFREWLKINFIVFQFIFNIFTLIALVLSILNYIK